MSVERQEIAELVRWRRRDDIEVETAHGVVQAGAVDIEVESGEGA